MGKPMQSITYLPMRFNDGARVSRKVRNAILDEAWKTFGGYSLDGPVTGAWLDTDDGTLYVDRSERLTVNCDNDMFTATESFVVRVGRQLSQKAMYFEVRYLDGVRILRISSA